MNNSNGSSVISPDLVNEFRKSLLAWGEINIRSYPWRYVDDPYRVIVSEFMLHRTQTRQVIPIYEQFVRSYPTLDDYAKANQDDVELRLQSLGLQWRIRGMLNALNKFWHTYHEIPVEYGKLISVATVGQYIAGAVICFSRNLPITLIDSNIVRVVGRVAGLDLKGEARRKKPVIKAIASVVDPDHPRDFYYAMIDLAHMICRPKNPKCAECPLQSVPCQFSLIDYGK